MRAFIEVCSVDSSDIYHSYDAGWKDFEDGVQYYSALRSVSDYLVTRNSKDFEESAIKVVSTEEACTLL